MMSTVARAGLDVPTTNVTGTQVELPGGVYPVEFASGTVYIHGSGETNILRVDIAKTGPQHMRGLMYRTDLAESAGMLFVYPLPHQGRFWMFDTFIPLSVAYADQNGTIFQIIDMMPCGENRTECEARSYTANRPFRFALEVNQGYFDRHGIRVGDRISYLAD